MTANRHNVIYQITQKDTKKKYILKVLAKSYFFSPLFRKLCTIKGNSLIHGEKIAQDRHYVYLLLPYCHTLPQLLALKGLSFQNLQQLSQDIGEALLCLHKEGVCHRDICPQNIFIDENGLFCLGDFSSSCFAKNPPIISWYFSKKYLRTSSTPSFAPPRNQANFSPYYQDLYSLSLLLFALLHHGEFPDKAFALKRTFSEDKNLFPEIDHVLQTILFPSEETYSCTAQATITFFSDLKKAFSLCQEKQECQDYFLSLQENDEEQMHLKKLMQEITQDLPKNRRDLRKGTACASALVFHHFTAFSCSIKKSTVSMLVLTSIILLAFCHSFLRPKNHSTKDSTPTFYAEAVSPSALLPSLAPKTTPFQRNASQNQSGEILNISKKSCHGVFLPDDIPKQIRPKILLASQNKFSGCDAFSCFPTVEELYANDNSISSLSGLSSLKKLKILNLAKNELRDIAPLSELTSLTILDLSHNHHLKNCRSLARLKNLEYLIVSNTNLSSEEISFLKKQLPLCTIFY